MIRWLAFIMLMLSLVATAIGVVAQRHESRALFSTLQQAELARDEARVEWSRLQLEQAWLAEAGRIERQARAELAMDRPDQVGILIQSPWDDAMVEARP